MRGRAIANVAKQAGDGTDEAPRIVQVALALHRMVAWLPARLLMLGYALAGSFDGALAAWRKPLHEGHELFPGPDDQRLGLVGCGAAPDSETADISTRADVALKLVIRVLWMIWCPALALLTLYGWLN